MEKLADASRNCWSHMAETMAKMRWSEGCPAVTSSWRCRPAALRRWTWGSFQLWPGKQKTNRSGKEAKHGRRSWRAWVLSSGQLLVPVTRSSVHISEA